MAKKLQAMHRYRFAHNQKGTEELSLQSTFRHGGKTEFLSYIFLTLLVSCGAGKVRP